MAENQAEKAMILLAAAVKKYGPFAFEQHEVVDNEDGFAVYMENDLLVVESWDGVEGSETE